MRSRTKAATSVCLTCLLLSTSSLPSTSALPTTYDPTKNVISIFPGKRVDSSPHIRPALLAEMDPEIYRRARTYLNAKYQPSSRPIERRSPSPIATTEEEAGNYKRSANSSSSLVTYTNQHRLLFDMAKTRQSVAVGLTEFFNSVDYGYGTLLSVGTPPREFLIIVDTGSSDLWIGSDGSYDLPSTFNPAKSSTYKALNKQIKISYGIGSFVGDLGTDVVTIGGLTVNNLTLASGKTTSSSFASQDAFDGILGLGPGSSSYSKSNTFMEQLILQKQAASSVFSLYLKRAHDSSGHGDNVLLSGGQLCLACVDSSKFVGEPTFFPVIGGGRWKIAIDGFVVNGKLVPNTSGEALPDSGTTLIWVDDGLFKALSRSTQSTIDPKTGFMHLPCSQFPSFGVSIGGKVFDLNLDDMIYSVTNDGKTSEPLCVVSVQGGLTIRDDPKKPFILLGDTFMKALYTIFDYNGSPNGRIGLAPVADLPNKTISTIISARQAESSVKSGTGSTGVDRNVTTNMTTGGNSNSAEGDGMGKSFAINGVEGRWEGFGVHRWLAVAVVGLMPLSVHVL